MSDHTTTPAAELDLQAWLVARVGGYLGRAPELIDLDTPLAELGLDSVYALTLCGDVEDAFGIEVEPTLAWDYPTVRALAEGLRQVSHV